MTSWLNWEVQLSLSESREMAAHNWVQLQQKRTNKAKTKALENLRYYSSTWSNILRKAQSGHIHPLADLYPEYESKNLIKKAQREIAFYNEFYNVMLLSKDAKVQKYYSERENSWVYFFSGESEFRTNWIKANQKEGRYLDIIDL